MSQYVTKLRERDGIQWPTPVGTWQQEEEINRLDMFANNLDVSQAATGTDLLNSVPTPWARLLLFEGALYKPTHPSHREIEDQWRGLLGVLALAEPLELRLAVRPFYLDNHAGAEVARSFAALRPHYSVNNHDIEAGKWNDFQLIMVDGSVLGATSPRTLVFTGIAHRCPPSVPFSTSAGRLTDPAFYYRRFGDLHFLGILAHWVGGLINTIEQDEHLSSWMGSVPAARGARGQRRVTVLLERLRAWRAEMQNVEPVAPDGQPVPRFTLAPYSVVNGVPRAQAAGESDLFLRGSRDVLVCYREPHAKLLTAGGSELMNERIKIYDGRWVQSGQDLPLPFNFLPPHISVLEDPLALFEDTLIKVNLPQNPDTVYALRLGDERSANTYLYPFKPEILRYLKPQQLAENTRISINRVTNKPRVELNIPLENNRVIRASREYDIDVGAVIVDAPTAGLAMWPDFVSPAWRRYFYIKASASAREVDFQPLAPAAESRSKENHTWYVTPAAADVFVGSVDNKRGLLLLRLDAVASPDKFWKVGIDFGSTHTRAYSLEVDRRDDRYVPAPGANISPVNFVTRARPLTFLPTASLEDSFFALAGEVDPPERGELKTLLMMPETNPGDVNGWLPREGYVYTHWLSDGEYNATHLRHDLKWNSNREDPDLRAYLRCLLLMIQAEALRQRARVISVSHTYPSVFTAGLVAKHKAEWRGLDQYVNSTAVDGDPKMEIQDATITETVAVCRHLEWEQQASPVENTISLDVGGSTTDMAVWAKKVLNVQESVKMASGVVSRYVQSPEAREFLAWLETTLHGAPYNLRSFSLAKFAGKPAGYGLMFHNLLSFIEWQDQLDVLVDQINAAEESKPLMSHIIYLYGGLLYYAGLLTRKAGLPKEQSSYHLYFCGKGGTLLRWVRGHREFVRQMFSAGLAGPGGKLPQPPEVDVRISRLPKEEVGRGLLAESRLEGKKKEEIGLVDTRPPTVTVGETGYHGLAWNGELDSAALLQLPKNVVPDMKDLHELSAFREAFKTSEATRAAWHVLRLDEVTDSKFQSNLLQRLFGAAKGSVVDDVQDRPKDALLEPLFITEIKVLLETATGNDKLFA